MFCILKLDFIGVVTSKFSFSFLLPKYHRVEYFLAFFVFHILVLFEVIPHHIVWAGKIKTPADLVRLEAVSLLILLVSALLVAMKMGYVYWLQGSKIIYAGMWVLFGLFVLNSLANFTAPNPVEKYGFGLVTILISLLCLRLALSSK